MMKNQLAGLMKQAQQMQDNLKRAQEHSHGALVTTDYRDLIANSGQVDAAIIAVPTSAHAAVGCALLPRLVLNSTLQDRSTFTLFTLAVMVSARFGGALSGIIATLLSTVAAVALILGPAATNSEQVADLTEIGLFCLVASGITWLAVQLHGARLRADGLSASSTGL